MERVVVPDPKDTEAARRVLREAQQNILNKLITFVSENGEGVLASSRAEYDSSGMVERLQGLHQEIFVVTGLLGVLPPPPPPAPAPPPKTPPPIEKSA
jgi:hypothetical protein